MPGYFWGSSVAFFALMVTSLLFFLKSVTTSQYKIIDTNENDLKIGIATFVSHLYLTFLLLHGLLLLSRNDLSPYEKLTLFALAIFPFILGIVCYVAFKGILKRMFLLTQPTSIFSQKELKEIEEVIEKFSDDLELEKKPKILVSTLNDISPFVFGRSSKTTYLVLPKNFTEIFKKVSGGNNRDAENLKDFILLHELSHIKHRDNKFIGMAFCLLKLFKYWVAAVFILSVFLTYLWGIEKVKRILGPINLGILYYGFLYLLTLSVSQKREYLSDARASTIMSSDALNSITEKKVLFKGVRISKLERLFYYFDLYSWKTNIMGIFRAVNSKKGILNSHPPNIDRISKLKEKHFIEGTSFILSKESATWLGIMYGLLFGLTHLYPDRTPIQIPQISVSTYDFLISLKSSIEILGMAVFLFMGMILPIIFQSKLKDHSEKNINILHYHIQVFTRFLLIYCVFIVSVLAIIPFFHDHLLFLRLSYLLNFPKPDDPLTLFLLLYLVTEVVISMQLSQNLNRKTSTQSRSVLKNTSQTIITAFLAVVTFATFIGVIIFLPIVAKPFIMKAYPILKKHFTFPVAFSILWGALITEFIYFYWAIKCPYIDSKLERYIVYINRKNILIRDQKGFERILLWRRKRYYFLIAIPIIILFFLLTSFSHIYIYVSILVSIGLFVYIFLKHKEALRFSNQFFHIYLDNLRKHLFLIKKICPEKIPDHREVILRKMDNFMLDDNSYKCQYHSDIGILATTEIAIKTKALLQVGCDLNNIAEWILKCEVQTGGFSPIVGIIPRISSTYKALSILDRSGMVKKLDTEIHSNWITNLQTRDGYYNDSMCKFSKIEQTFYGLGSLHFLGNVTSVRNIMDP